MNNTGNIPNEAERERIENNKRIRRLKRQTSMKRFRTNFGIFMKSRYGKAGFYILVSFAIISLLTPIIAPQPFSYVAPEIDTHVAQLDAAINLSANSGSSIYGPFASSTTSTGCFVVYYALSNGTLMANGLGASNQTRINSTFYMYHMNTSSSNSLLNPLMFPMLSYTGVFNTGSYVLQNFVVMSTTNGNISIGKVVWSYGITGTGVPSVRSVEKLHLNGTIVEDPVSDSASLQTILPTWVPFYQLPSGYYENTGQTIGNPGLIFAVTHNATGYYLNEMQAYPLTLRWSIHLASNEAPKNVEYYGSYFEYGLINNLSNVLVSCGSNISAFSPLTGEHFWTVNFNSQIAQGPYIPFGYEITPFAYNSLFVATDSGSVYSLNLTTRALDLLFNSSSPVTAFSSSYGLAGFPSPLLSVTSSSVYLTNQTVSGALDTSSYKLPSGYGEYYTSPIYDPSSSSFVFASSHGLLFSLKSGLGTNPFTWSASISPTPVNMSQGISFQNAASGKLVIGVISSASILYIYETTAKDINPLPPSFHTPSGAIYPLGTNSAGQDLFSQFIQSFWTDYLIGAMIGLATIFIGVMVAMIIGYKGGFTGNAFETISLAIYLIPGLALLIALQSIIGYGSFLNIVWIVTFVSWPFAAFTLIGVVRQIRARTYVEAARVSGAGFFSIIRRHVFPNIAPLTLYLLALNIGGAVGTVATLQVLGLAPLTLSTWGGMLNSVLNNFYYVLLAPWWIFPPTIALTMFIFSFIFISRGLDEVTNPRLRRR